MPYSSIRMAAHYCGAKFDQFDKRDLHKRYPSSKIPSEGSEVDLRKYVPRVYDQRKMNSCTANALCAAYSIAMEMEGAEKRFKPSRMFVWYNGRGEIKENVGAYVRDTIKAMKREGVCRESLWPYKSRNLDKEPPEEIYMVAKRNVVKKYQRLEPNVDQLRACLYEKCPFVFACKIIFDSFDRASEGGMVPIPSDEERENRPLDCHAMTAVGYDDKERHFIVLNSWGREWGDEGYCYMPYDYFRDKDLCHFYWKVTFMTQDS